MCDTGLFHAFNRQRGKEEPRKEQTQTGAGTKISHPEPKRRVNLPMVPPGGFLRGNNSSGSELFPLKPASLHTFLPEQESMAPLASARSASGVNFAG